MKIIFLLLFASYWVSIQSAFAQEKTRLVYLFESHAQLLQTQQMDAENSPPMLLRDHYKVHRMKGGFVIDCINCTTDLQIRLQKGRKRIKQADQIEYLCHSTNGDRVIQVYSLKKEFLGIRLEMTKEGFSLFFINDLFVEFSENTR